MADAGKIAPTYDSEWSSDKTYDFHTYVTHNGNCYIAKQPSTGVEPVDEENEYWFLALKNVTQEQYEAIVNGTTAVGNANKLGGKGASEYALQSTVNNIQSVSRMEITTDGWYRIAQILGSDENYCKLAIVKQWASNGSETHVIEYVQTYSNRVLKSTSDNVSSNQTIKKVRVTTEGNYRYIEIYYSANNATKNGITWSVVDNISLNTTDRWHTISAVPTYESVDGVTIEATYDIPANVSPVTTADLANYLPKSGGTLTGIPYFGNKKKFISWHDNDLLMGVYDSENSTANSTRLQVGNATGFDLANALILSRLVNGVETKYPVLHTGNVGSYALPKSGGGKVDGNVEATTFVGYTSANTQTLRMFMSGERAFMRHFIDTDNYESICLDMRGAPVFEQRVNGVMSGYLAMHHDGNSAKVAIQETAPTDTSALWVDSTNKKTKAYIDGAWTALA